MERLWCANAEDINGLDFFTPALSNSPHVAIGARRCVDSALDLSDGEEDSVQQSVTGDDFSGLFSFAEMTEELDLLSKLGAIESAKAAQDDIFAMLALTMVNVPIGTVTDDAKDCFRSGDSGLGKAAAASNLAATPKLERSQMLTEVPLKRHRSSPEDLGRLSYMLEEVIEHGKPIEQVVVEMRHSTFIQNLALVRKGSQLSS